MSIARIYIIDDKIHFVDVETEDITLFELVVDLSNYITSDGWITAGETWTYVSIDVKTGKINVNADVTGKYFPGFKIKYTQNATVKYGIITVVGAYAAGVTPITFWGGTDYTLADAVISSNFYSVVKAPFGFPLSPSKWKIRVIDSTDRTQANPVDGTWYNLGGEVSQITIPIGIWDVYYNVNLQQTKAAVVFVGATLSTGNNTESDAEITASLNSVAAYAGGVVSKQKTIIVAAKTLYYLNTKILGAGVGAIYNRNGVSGSIMIMEAVCVYL